VIEIPKSSHPTGLAFMCRNPHPKREHHGDCGVRSVCLALDLSYSDVWFALLKDQRESVSWPCGDGEWRYCGGTPTGGLKPSVLQRFLRKYGWLRTPCATGTKFKASNLPPLCIAELASHFVCVRDGAIWDTWDSRGKRPKKLVAFYAPYKGRTSNPDLYP